LDEISPQDAIKLGDNLCTDEIKTIIIGNEGRRRRDDVVFTIKQNQTAHTWSQDMINESLDHAEINAKSTATAILYPVIPPGPTSPTASQNNMLLREEEIHNLKGENYNDFMASTGSGNGEPIVTFTPVETTQDKDEKSRIQFFGTQLWCNKTIYSHPSLTRETKKRKMKRLQLNNLKSGWIQSHQQYHKLSRIQNHPNYHKSVLIQSYLQYHKSVRIQT